MIFSIKILKAKFDISQDMTLKRFVLKSNKRMLTNGLFREVLTVGARVAIDLTSIESAKKS